jgi:lipoprotein-anchoring transpeptidase ErfK/SrfK
MTVCLRVFGGVVVRVSISYVVIALALAGSLGVATAQSYSPPSPQSYTSAPVPPLDVGAQSAEPSYGPGYDEQAREYPPAPYSPADRPHFAPADRAASQAPPSPGGELVPRPPADVSSGSAQADYTGSVRSPAGTNPVPGRATVIAGLPPEDQPEGGPAQELPAQFRRQLVDYVTSEPAGTIIIDTPHTYLYLMLVHGKALRYGVGVGREGFTWTGTERISRVSEWPDWHPPKEMIERQPYLPRFMAGGEGNPLGARALYLGNTVYRIHGTNQPSTIGHFVSSGCIRLTNEDVADLYSRVNVGTRVVVLPGSPAVSASASGPVAR